MRKSLLFISWLAITVTGFAQTFTTPEVFSFKQEVFRPISYYTGQANVSIPLTQIQTPEITIPITLNYVGGGGLRPANPYSSAGMGWRISAGGAITRSKNGVCDEVLGSPPSVLHGFFHLTPNTVTNSYVRNNVSSYVATDGSGRQYFSPQTEYSPDIFSFSFLGYSGYFLMGYDGQFKIQSQDIVAVQKVDNVSWPGSGNTVGFKLTANDGTIFTFGINTGSMELSGGAQSQPFQVEAWYLSKIESTNGRVINFNYQPNSSSPDAVIFMPSSEAGVNTRNYPVVLTNITFNGGKVVFTSSGIPHQITDVPCTPRMISQIELQGADSKAISRTSFTYSSTSAQRYYFLDDVTVDGRKYLFTYLARSDMPARNVALGTDFWGFYNGHTEQPAPIGGSNPAYNWDIFLNFSLTFSSREPSFSHARRGLLESITYPTGGIETYEYEANTYSYKGMQTMGGGYYTTLYEPITTGGARIAKITLGNMVRKYKYVNEFDPDNQDYNPPSSSPLEFTSSGILYKSPVIPYYGRSVLNSLSIEGEPSIVYYKVFEVLADKSYTEYTMRSPLDKLDGDNNQNTNYFQMWASNTGLFAYIPKEAFIGSLGRGSSRSLERGQVAKVRVFDASNTLKKSTAYTYATDPNRYTQNVAAVYMAGTADNIWANFAFDLKVTYLPGMSQSLALSMIHSYEIYTFPVYLEQEVEETYENGTTLTRTTQYQYNAERLRSSTTTTNSKGETLKTQVRYPADINAGVYASMVTKKMLNFPVEQLQVEQGDVTAASLTTYKANGSSYVADQKFSLELSTPLLETSFTNFNGTTKDSRYGTVANITYDSYGTYGNVRQTTGKDGIVTSYLWDASAIYPMAQVKAATYSQISAQDGKAASYSNSTLFASLSGLVPAAFINTYSYKPLVGMTGATDQRGRNSYYVYDQYNRLTLIKDHDNNIVKKYCYNYQGQTVVCEFYGNQLVSQTKRRNNCTSCQIGSQVTYSVPADTYFGTTQTEANNLAAADIAANAQNYANANGTCSSPVMTSLVSTNSILTKSFTVVFRNNCTNFDYSYTLNQNTSNVTLSPQLPTGNYNVTFTPVGGGTTNYGFMVNDFYQFGSSANILGVDIVSGSNQVRITP
ncbi:MAG: DUF5977 domain-containing protein [Agriterribacter sp.]